jgi:hypothetical protein
VTARASKPKLVRRKDWEARLHAYFDSARDRPHAYGRHDCMLHAAAAVRAVTGHDFGKGHRGKYRCEASATDHLARHGFRSAVVMLDSLMPRKPIAFAQRGDIVLADGIPGVCNGHEALLVGQNEEDGREGLIAKPRETWTRCWSVGPWPGDAAR